MMRRLLFAGALLLALTLRSVAEEATSTGGTLRDFFASHGFAGAPMERRFGNHIFVISAINGKRAALLVDTGAPVTLIDKNSIGTLGLAVQTTKSNVGGVFGRRWEHYGISKISSMTLGNCTLVNVPVALSDESGLNYYRRIAHIDGLFGAREMLKFGMVIDCARQMLYVSPNGPSAGTSQQLAALLAGKGFTRIPLRLTANHHFDLPATINEHSTRLIMDTGAGSTVLGKEIAAQAGVGAGLLGPSRIVSDAGDGRHVPIDGGLVKKLSVGDFEIDNAEVELAPIASEVLRSKSAGESNAGLLGEEYLSFNFAVIDIGGMSLYLRHADKR